MGILRAHTGAIGLSIKSRVHNTGSKCIVLSNAVRQLTAHKFQSYSSTPAAKCSNEQKLQPQRHRTMAS